jgi:hypothetical protein
MLNINPYDSMNNWKQCCTTQLADAQRYYEKWEVDKKIDDIIISGGSVTPDMVQEMIDESISGVTEEVNELAAIVSGQTAEILNRYTKQETNELLQAYLSKVEANSMFANYSKVENTTLILNNENITI